MFHFACSFYSPFLPATTTSIPRSRRELTKSSGNFRLEKYVRPSYHLRNKKGPPANNNSLMAHFISKTLMDYQLVLQFRGDTMPDYDAVVALEEVLTAELGDSADVDGHDVGSGETNIFIFTSDPQQTFEQAKPLLERRRCLQSVTAAYREADGEEYTVIWPEGSEKEFVIA
jgi:hypothetical protein